MEKKRKWKTTYYAQGAWGPVPLRAKTEAEALAEVDRKIYWAVYAEKTKVVGEWNRG